MSKITKMEVYPVAGKDCMELNLSGAHAPYFTRNVVVLTMTKAGPASARFLAEEKRSRRLSKNAFRLSKAREPKEYRSTLLKVKKHLD